MSIPRIVRGPVEPDLWRMAEEIFFLSAATQQFSGEKERKAFLDRWTGYYRECEPEQIYLAVLPDGEVSGYLTGCLDSRFARRLYRDIPYFSLFEDRFAEYPAHLHVNVHPKRRNCGIGSRLVKDFVGACEAAGTVGVHVVTAPGLPNVEFYRNCGFTIAVQREWRERSLLFLGRSLRRC